MSIEGVYSQINDLYSDFGNRLFIGIDTILFWIPQVRTSKEDLLPSLTPFDLIALGEALIERENGHLIVSTYLEFKRKYETDTQMKSFLEPARKFVENLPNTLEEDYDLFLDKLRFLYDDLKSKTLVGFELYPIDKGRRQQQSVNSL